MRSVPYVVPRKPVLNALEDSLDLLDNLVDPLLDIGVCKSRVQTWKLMMRQFVEDYQEEEER